MPHSALSGTLIGSMSLKLARSGLLFEVIVLDWCLRKGSILMCDEGNLLRTVPHVKYDKSPKPAADRSAQLIIAPPRWGLSSQLPAT